ncbi:hypothetical protein GCM10008024_21820 [Allgaiera indica]|uniref:Uncharacterized protein n=1 Tax=Allgaiera indica TaxID=765699 RepID=A0AAN4USL0_9RHOB|nr:hypothetical protein GCM10008024_21820 [Allgaiera indica]
MPVTTISANPPAPASSTKLSSIHNPKRPRRRRVSSGVSAWLRPVSSAVARPVPAGQSPAVRSGAFPKVGPLSGAGSRGVSSKAALSVWIFAAGLSLSSREGN